jgi:hypothetical protein
MLERFEQGKFYIYNGPIPRMEDMRFVTDGEPHKCIGAHRSVCILEEEPLKAVDWVLYMGYWEEVKGEELEKPEESMELASRILPKKLKRKPTISKGGW